MWNFTKNIILVLVLYCQGSVFEVTSSKDSPKFPTGHILRSLGEKRYGQLCQIYTPGQQKSLFTISLFINFWPWPGHSHTFWTQVCAAWDWLSPPNCSAPGICYSDARLCPSDLSHTSLFPFISGQPPKATQQVLSRECHHLIKVW